MQEEVSTYRMNKRSHDGRKEGRKSLQSIGPAPIPPGEAYGLPR
jgi:hypothetical protein